MKWHFGMKVRHATKGWQGWVAGAGYGRSPSRWVNPDVLYVDWLHRKPSTSAAKPSELKP